MKKVQCRVSMPTEITDSLVFLDAVGDDVFIELIEDARHEIGRTGMRRRTRRVPQDFELVRMRDPHYYIRTLLNELLRNHGHESDANTVNEKL